MEHLGDICKINGAEVKPCWVIIGGSPCQDLSIAGKRAGLAGERSGLFMEQIRIVKEMRDKDVSNGRTNEHIRPRLLLWENVPGALSSGEPKGEDFRIVLEECARVKDPNAVIPRPPKGKWQNCGCIVGDGWSIAWTIRNAQFYGIPQRRRRIALVADFGGQSAAEILFESKSVSGNNRESHEERETREDTRGSAEGFGVAERGGKLSEVGAISFQERAGKPGGGKGLLIQEEHIGSMKTNDRQSVCVKHYPINGDVTPPLDAHYYLGCGARGGVEREVVASKVGGNNE